MEPLANKYLTVLVTGASGFIGRKLTFSLAEMGYHVLALCRNKHHPYLLPHRNIDFIEGDILDTNSLDRILKNCYQVYHTAALAKMWCKNEDEFFKVNVLGTRNIMKCALNAGVEKLVHTSTCGIWGPTINLPACETDPRTSGFQITYERTKYLAELEVQKFMNKDLEVVIVNPSRVYGEGPLTGSNTVGRIINAYLNGTWHFIPGDGKAITNYAYLDDVVSGHISAMQNGIAGERYILGGEDISFTSFFNSLGKISRKDKHLYKIPLNVIKAYSHIEKLKALFLGTEPFFLPEFAERLKCNQQYSSAKAMTELNYQITPFLTGLERTINSIQQLKR